MVRRKVGETVTQLWITGVFTQPVDKAVVRVVFETMSLTSQKRSFENHVCT
jgi:hypothetical protein